jgi:hypothetical protein
LKKRTKLSREFNLLSRGGGSHFEAPRLRRRGRLWSDEKALEAVRTWRFDPAKKDGRPVAVQMNIIVNFHLF